MKREEKRAGDDPRHSQNDQTRDHQQAVADELRGGKVRRTLQFTKDGGQVQADQLSRYNVGMIWTMARLVFTGLVLIYFAVVAIRAFRRLGVMERGVAAGPGSILVTKPSVLPDRVKV